MDWVDFVRQQDLEETAGLLRKGEAEAYISTSVDKILKSIEGFVDAICKDVPITDQPSDFGVSYLLRCAVKRAQESLIAITELTKGSQAYYAMPLLRPICEDFIFIRYMKFLPRKEADAYLYEKVMLDLLEGVEAQRSFFDTVQKDYPNNVRERFKPHHWEAQDLLIKISEQKTRLKVIGKKLGWGNQPAPKVKYMAEKTGIDEEYAFFYRATSSAVHSNLHYIWRMVWGDPEVGMVITNKNFDVYYRHFVLTYGTWLTTAIVDEVSEEFTEQWSEAAEDAFVDYDIWRDFVKFMVGATRFPPIVTEVELRWPEGNSAT